MSGDDVERVLAEALDAQARARVRADVAPPLPRFAGAPTESQRAARPRRAWLAPAAAAAVVVAIVGLVLGLTRAGPAKRPVAAGSTAHSSASSVRSATPAVPAAPVAVTKPVRMRVTTDSGATYGVGMPVVVLISHRITDARAFQRATNVTVDGHAVDADWYFEPSTRQKGYPLEAHLRTRTYWRAHARVYVSLAAHGVSAGDGYHFADDAQLSFFTGAAMISTVDDRTHVMTVRRDDKVIDKFPVSLGAKKTPTARGTKVVMSKGASICMHGPGYDECGIKDTQRLTYGGEYLHSAPWNVSNIDRGVDSSNGCTNMLPSDAAAFYAQSEVGDVVRFPNSNGPTMTAGAGLGDWNVSWSTWLRGGVVPTH
ncbi:L,D-transpeptidase [uncultured Jatrophihabitans sp.]|uniref:L,D-transpeptidase n=1 Tax=uncultured Jatrophihabitans sp. TaxID=1610747 RepID=UPI0035CAB443